MSRLIHDPKPITHNSENMFVSVLSDKPEVRVQFCSLFGSSTSSDDISFYNANGRVVVEPTLFPNKIQSLLHSLAIADFVVLIVDQLTPHVGEIIVALDLLRKDKGVLVTSLNLPIGGTALEKYHKTNDLNVAKAKVLELNAEQNDEQLFALIDKSHSVPETGHVALGVVKGGKLKKQETFFLLPDKKEVAVRSVRLNDKEVEEAVVGDRFGIVYKGDLIERGILAPLRNNFEISSSVNGRFLKSPFFKDDLDHKVHIYHNYQFVEGNVSDNELRLDKPIAYQKGDRILVVDPSNQKLRIAGVFTSAW